MMFILISTHHMGYARGDQRTIANRNSLLYAKSVLRRLHPSARDQQLWTSVESCTSPPLFPACSSSAVL